MSMSDPVADMLTRIRNGLSAKKADVSMPASKAKEAILKVLVSEGYLNSYETGVDSNSLPVISVNLKYYQGRPVTEQLKRVSKPGCRVYKDVSDLPSVEGGLGVAIVSTSHGVMTEKQARKTGAGGEIICTVF